MKKSLVALPFFAAALAVTLATASMPTRGGDTVRWETLRVYVLASGARVAVAVPSEWSEIDKAPAIGQRAALRFVDASGHEITIPVAELAQASAERRVARPVAPGNAEQARR
jgi:hypothetical protein